MSIDLSLVGASMLADLTAVALPFLALALHPSAVSGLMAICEWVARKINGGD